MRLEAFERKLALPDGFEPPRRLTHAGLVATVLGRDDLADDLLAVNSSLELIRRTRGGDWPSAPVSEDFDLVDLAWHECEFRERLSFSYVLRDAAGGYVGCAYLYPMGRRTVLTEALADHDVDVSWWVTEPAYRDGLYGLAHEALGRWVSEDYPFTNPYWSNRELP